MAEIELSVLARQCLEERMESQEELEQEVSAWQARRNAARARVEWQGREWSGKGASGVAVHDGRCPRQVEAALPSNTYELKQ